MGKAFIEEVGDNFYRFIPEKRNNRAANGFTIGISMLVLVGIVVSIYQARQNKKESVLHSSNTLFTHPE